MASTIASQLNQLRNRKGNAPGGRHGRPSLLFSYQEAADMDLEYLHGIAVSGYEALCTMDDRYVKLGQDLFESNVLSVKAMEQQTKEERRVWDAKIEDFLLLLSRHFLHQAAFKVLEFLIRKFKVNEYNVEALMKCVLPYHATNEFVRLVQTIKLDGSIWYFLAKLQQSGAAVPRHVLVTRCHTDPALLRFVCSTTEKAAVLQNRTWIAFTAALLCEYITQAKPAGESIVREVLPTILHGLDSPLYDCQAAAFLILTHLTCVANLSQDFLSSVMGAMLKTSKTKRDTHRAVFMVLAKIASSQPNFHNLPDLSLIPLASHDHLTSNLCFLSERKAILTPLLSKIVSALTASTSVLVQCTDKLVRIIHEVQLPDSIAEQLADRLLARAAESTSSDKTQVQASLTSIFRALDLRYSSQLDGVVNRYIKLARYSISKQSDLSNEHTMDIDSEEDIAFNAHPSPLKPKEAQQLLDFIYSTFQHSTHTVLQLGDQVSTLALAVNAPAAQIRIMALQKLDQLSQAVQSNDADTAFVHSCILKSLEDDELDVIQAGLTTQTFPSLPFIAVLDAISSLLSKTQTLLSLSNTKLSQKVLVNAVKALANCVASHNPDRWPAASAQLLACSLSHKSAAKLAVAAVEGLKQATAAQCPALSSALADVCGHAAESQTKDVAPMSKTSTQTVHNAQLIKALSSAFKADSKLISTFAALCSNAPPRALHTILLSLNHCCSSGAAAQQLAAAAGIIQIATSASGLAVLSQITDSDVSPPTAILDSAQLPTDFHTKQLSKDDSFAHVHKLLLTHALLQACKVLGQNQHAAGQNTQPSATRAALNDSPSTMATSLMSQLTTLPSYRSLLPHLQALLPSLSQDPLQYLLDIVLSPQPMTNSHILDSAILLLPYALSPSLSPTPPSYPAHPSLDTKHLYSALSALLVCISHASQSVREAALDSLTLLAPEISSSSTSSRATRPATASVSEAITALLQHKKAITKDSNAFTHLVQNSLASTKPPGSESLSPAPPARSKKGGKKARSKGGVGSSQVAEDAAAKAAVANESDVNASDNILQSTLRLSATSDALEALTELMLQHMYLGVHVTAMFASCLRDSVTKVTLVQHVVPVINTHMFGTPVLDRPQVVTGVLTQSEAEAVAYLVSFIFSDITLSVGKQPLGITYVSLLSSPDVLSFFLSPDVQSASSGALSLVRLAAISLLSPQLMERTLATLPLNLQSHCLEQILQIATKDNDRSCQEAARLVLHTLHITAQNIIPLLRRCMNLKSVNETLSNRDANTDATPPVKRRKARSAGQSQEEPTGVPAAPAPTLKVNAPSDVELMLASLELLQWKSDISERASLLPILAELLTALLPLLAPVDINAESAQDHQNPSSKDSVLSQATLTSLRAVAPYASQLALSAVGYIIRDTPQASADSAADGATPGMIQQLLSLSLDSVSHAPDNATRTAALSLLSTIATHHPDATVQSVLRVVRVTSEASALVGSDPYASGVVSEAFAAVVPAWLSCGREAEGLWELVLGVLPTMPSERRLSVLLVLLQAVPEEAGLAVALQLLVRDAEKAREVEREQKAGSKLEGKSTSKTKEGKKEVDGGVELDVRARSEWLLELAAGLSSQVGIAERMYAFSQLLQRAVKAAGGKPSAPLPLLASGFVSGQLKLAAAASKSSVVISNDAVGAESAGAKTLQGGCRVLMEQALENLRLLSQGKSTSADLAAVKVLYDIVRRLETMMPVTGYVSALTDLLSCQSDKIQLQALKLLASKLMRVAEKIAEDEGVRGDAGRSERVKERSEELLACAMGVCPDVATLLGATGAATSTGPSSPLTRQAALVVIQTLAQHYSPKDPSPLLSCVPIVLSTCKDANVNVRMSALACLAPLVKCLGVRLVPLLQTLADCALEAAQSACDGPEEGAAKQRGEDERENDDGAEGTPRQPSTSLQLSVSLATLDSMLTTLGPFLKPYLPTFISLLTHPRLISESTSTIERFASSMRQRLPSLIPPRLLLEPLFSSYPSALSSSQASATQLLAMLEHTCSGMDPKVATTHHQALFDFLLTALDARESSPPSISSPHAVEDAAVKALVALVMKLSEKTFKPMYLRLVEWGGGSAAAAAAAAGSGALPSGRLLALFSASSALGAKLRSVFVPYFRYIMDACAHHLAAADPSAAPSSQPKKKRKHLSQDAAAAASASPPAWVLRTKIIRALHRCFLHDMDGFLDTERFHRLLPPLVTQLELVPLEDALLAVEEQCGDRELDAGLKCGSGVTDVAGGALVRCLVQMAVTAGSDVLWKPLNHQVLMASRNGSPRTRLLALEVVAGLVDKLREEYLILLPETLPFLAELMEDVGTPVEVRTQEVLKLLEEVSGEKLDQYLM